jgi:hypothetical protein
LDVKSIPTRCRDTRWPTAAEKRPLERLQSAHLARIDRQALIHMDFRHGHEIFQPIPARISFVIRMFFYDFSALIINFARSVKISPAPLVG